MKLTKRHLFVKGKLMKSMYTLVLLCVLVGACTRSDSKPLAKETSLTNDTISNNLPNGSYLILRSNNSTKDLSPLSADERLVLYEGTNENGNKEPPLYLVVSTTESVPFELLKPAERLEHDNGRFSIGIDLTPPAAERFAEVTGKYHSQDKRMATVIGGKVVSTHAIRARIEGGSFRVGCCNLVICENLLAALKTLTN